MIKKHRSFESKNSNSLNAMIKKTSMTFQNNFKKITSITIAAIMLTAIGTFGFSPIGEAFAKGKPLDVIERSNGFPSGPHFNLIIHGKESFDSSNCAGDGGKSVFTPLNSTEGAQSTDQTLQMFVNKKSSLSTLEVKDKCTEAFDTDPAQVQLPTKIESDGEFVNIEGGFWVFARVLGTPNHGGPNGDVSSIALWPDPNIEACNLNGTSGEEDASDCFDSSGNKKDFVELGYATKDGIYKCADPNNPDETVDCDDQGLVRYDSTTSGKGAKKAVDITPLFLWTGVGCTDIVEDGQITIDDFDISANNSTVLDAGDSLNVTSIITADHISWAEGNATYTDDDDQIDFGDFDGVNEFDEFEELLIILGSDDGFEACVFEENTWVFDVFGADLVIQNQTLTNDGVKNLQIRFYPQETTYFEPSYDLSSTP